MSDLRRDFPAFDQAPDGSTPTAYLDSAATSQRPRQVLDAEREYLEHHLAPVHRGASAAVGHSTTLFEDARATVARFVGAGEREIVWTENATDAINMVALGIADASAGLGGASARPLALEPGDEIVVTEAEHHANLIPWQRLAAKTGARLRAVRVDEHGLWTADDLAAELSDRTRIVAVAEVSNVTGYLAPVADVVSLAHARGARVVLDACQSVPHRPTDFGAMGVDFAAFSGHKMLGPNGIGVLYGREELLDVLPPARTGGSTITRVTLETAEFLPSPHRFEAGTQPVSQAVALAEAVRYLEAIGMHEVARHESELAARIVEGVSALPGRAHHRPGRRCRASGTRRGLGRRGARPRRRPVPRRGRHHRARRSPLCPAAAPRTRHHRVDASKCPRVHDRRRGRPVRRVARGRAAILRRLGCPVRGRERMSGLEGLYQQIILEQAKARHGDGPLDHADAEHHEYNPTCGDELTMRIRLDDSQTRIAELAWQGDGCSISMASASTLTELASGREVDEVRGLIDGFRAMLRSQGQGEPDEDLLGDAIAFHGVSKYVMRVKCAMLGWVALEACLTEASAVSAAPAAAE